MLLAVNFFMSLIMSVLFYMSVIKLSSSKYNRKKAIYYILCLALFIALIRNYEYYNNTISTLKIIAVVTVIALTNRLILIENIQKSIYFTIIIYIIVLINDSIIAFILVKVLGLEIKALQMDAILILLTNIIISCLSYVQIIFVKSIWNKKKTANKTNKNTVYILFALITFIVTAFNVLVYNKYIEMIDKSLMLLNIFITSAYFILTMAVYKVYSNLVVNEQENKQLRVYINMADELIDEYRRVRHNTYNIIQAASAFIEENDMEGLKDHFSSVIERQKGIEKSNMASLYKIDHPGVKSLLSSKLGRIEALSLNLNLEITTDLKEVKVNISDLCEILGVFLDNSIEAAKSTKEKYIELCMFEDDQYYITIIKNSYDPNQDKRGSGIGLRTVNSILRRYGLIFNNTIIEKKYYTQELIIKKFK